MIKFIVMFNHPEDMDKFENAYNDFLALVERMPDIQRRQVVHVTGSPMGEAPYYRIMEIYFDSEEQMRESLTSKPGQEAGLELARLGEGAFQMMYAEVYEEAGGKTGS